MIRVTFESDMMRSFQEEFEYHVLKPHTEILAQSLLIFGFSAYDAFAGMLLKRLYREEPTLIFKLEEKEVKVSELLRSQSIEETIERIVERDVSSLLRESYDDQFSRLANRHGVSTLKKFANWPLFVEAAQRRNLITHCNGVVNAQYMNACRDAGYRLNEDIEEGFQLTANLDYVQTVMDILYEVGVKFGHTLWRVAAPARTDESDKILTDELFDLLVREEWHLAKVIGEFTLNLPGRKHDLQNKISRINYAQALKWSGDNEGAMKILDVVDWSGSIRDLRLGVAVLREEYDNASQLMREIGERGELVLKSGYVTWPVFREFRKSSQFLATFKAIYGEEFSAGEECNAANQIGGDSVKNCLESPVEDRIEQQPPTSGDSSMPSQQPIEDVQTPEAPPEPTQQ